MRSMLASCSMLTNARHPDAHGKTSQMYVLDAAMRTWNAVDRRTQIHTHTYMHAIYQANTQNHTCTTLKMQGPTWPYQCHRHPAD